MPKIKKIPLKQNFLVIFGFEILIILVIVVVSALLFQNQGKLSKSRDVQFNSYLLADELRQSSDDLTRFARAYVATGNSEFEREYWAVLDIRNGILPRPLHYNRVYWDFIFADKKKPRDDGKATSLRSLMEAEGFTTEEFAKLSQAQKNSDELVKIEKVAMNAVKGLSADEQGNFILMGEPNLTLANDLLNNEAYYKIKAEIMRPIDDFYQMFEERTKTTVEKYRQFAVKLEITLLVLSALLAISSISSFIILTSQINAKEKVEKELVSLSKNLEYKVKDRTKLLEDSQKAMKNALQQAETFNQHLVGRELKMIELKKQLTDIEKKI